MLSAWDLGICERPVKTLIHEYLKHQESDLINNINHFPVHKIPYDSIWKIPEMHLCIKVHPNETNSLYLRVNKLSTFKHYETYANQIDLLYTACLRYFKILQKKYLFLHETNLVNYTNYLKLENPKNIDLILEPVIN